MKRFPTCNRVETDEVAKFDSVTVAIGVQSPTICAANGLMIEFNRTCWSKDGAKMGALRVDTWPAEAIP